MSNNYSPVYLVFAYDVGGFHGTARNYKKDALLINNNNFSACSPAFHMLSTIAFELFLKVLIALDVCIKYKDDENKSSGEIIEEISNEIKKYSHNLETLFLTFPYLMTSLNIKSISYFSNDIVSEYIIKTDTQPYIPLKSLDGIRYGSFAKSKDTATLCVNDKDIIDLLNLLEEYVDKQYMQTNIELQKYFS